MGFMDKVKGMMGQHSDKVAKGADKAGEKADAATKGKYSDKIKSGTEKAKDQAERMGQEGGQEGRGGKGPGES